MGDALAPFRKQVVIATKFGFDISPNSDPSGMKGLPGAGIDATDDLRLHRRHDLQVCGEATAGEGLVALGQGLN